MRRVIAPVVLGLLLSAAMPPGHAGGQDLQRARELNAEAAKHVREGKYQEGIPKAKEALAIREQALGPDHPQVAESLQTLGELLRNTGDYAGARPLLERALRIREQTRGPNSLEVATSLNHLGFLHYLTGEYAGARPMFERALKILEQALGPDHPAAAFSLNNLGLLFRSTGDLATARPLLERALKIRSPVLLGPLHPDRGPVGPVLRPGPGTRTA